MCLESKDQLEKVKWFLWHGKPDKALKRLGELQRINSDETISENMSDLYEYIARNKKYIVNYQQRQEAKLPFTSTYAESSVNTIINQRQKNDKKMQWSRDGAHNILQIRTSRFSQTWKLDWEMARQEIYKKAA